MSETSSTIREFGNRRFRAVQKTRIPRMARSSLRYLKISEERRNRTHVSKDLVCRQVLLVYFTSCRKAMR